MELIYKPVKKINVEKNGVKTVIIIYTKHTMVYSVIPYTYT